GEALIDFLAEPEAGDGRPPRFACNAGGAPANVAVGIARLGGNSRFAGMLATVMFGDYLLGELAAHGVDTTATRRTDAAPTALAFVSLAAGGERSFSFYRPPAADLLFTAADFDDDLFVGLAAFHACSNSLTEPDIAAATMHGMRRAAAAGAVAGFDINPRPALRPRGIDPPAVGRAAAAGAVASFDINLRPALWPREVDPAPVVWKALEHAQLVKLSREELAFLARDGGEATAVERLLAHAEVVLATDGAAPIRWWTRSASGSAPTFAVQSIDTTAAGDAFVAALLQRIAGHGVDAGTLGFAFDDAGLRDDILRHAAAAGALATTALGAFAAMPAAAEVRALLAESA